MDENVFLNNTVMQKDANNSEPQTQLIDVIYPPILVSFGVTFNVLIIIVMRHRYFRRQSTSVYMTAGALNDAISLLISMTTHWLYVTFDGIYDRNKVRGICKFLDFYGWGNCDLGILITTAMTVDRAVAIGFPLKQKSRNKIARARVIVVILSFIVIAKEFHFFWGSDMVIQTRKERLCDVVPSTEAYKFFWDEVWPWLHFSFLLLCFIVIVASNGVLLYFVVKSAHIQKNKGGAGIEIRKSSQNNNNQHVRIDNQWRTITPMLIGESFVLLVFTFPFTVQLSIAGNSPDFYKQVGARLVFSVTFYMLYTNKCITFIVYLVTGSRFRIAMGDCLLACFRGKQALRKKRFQENFLQTMFSMRSNNGKNSFPSQDSLEQSSSNDLPIKLGNHDRSFENDQRSLTESTHL